MSILNMLFGNRNADDDSLKVLPAAEYKAAISTGKVQLVDVRSSREFQMGHIPKAVNIDFYRQDVFKSAFNKFDKQKPIYIYCQSGGRSRNAGKILKGLGFTQIVDLKGGYMRW